MSRILVLYYSRTGNTEKMAKSVAEGARTAPELEVELSYYADPEILGKFDAIAVGVPTCHRHVTLNIRELFEEVAAKNVELKGKLGADFGSYGWSEEAPSLFLNS